MKHYKTVEFLSVLRMSSPPVEYFLATVLHAPPKFLAHLVVLCFERRCPTPKHCCSLKVQILGPSGFKGFQIKIKSYQMKKRLTAHRHMCQHTETHTSTPI